MAELSRLARTVSHLKLRQIAYRLIRRIGRTTRIQAVPGTVAIRQELGFIPAAARKSTGEGWSFTFLNVGRTFDSTNMDWSPADMSKLWRYNLHYFDYLQESGRSWQDKAFLIDDWIARNPQGAEDAWEPFPVSLRMVNWIKLFLSAEAAGKVSESWLRSLYQQALWLEKNIEYHLLANHLFKNGKALLFAGAFFAGTDGDRWRTKGLEIISRELDEQILPDGGHFERSPMYHAMVLEDCLDMLNLAAGSGELVAGSGGLGADLFSKLRIVCPRMVSFLDGMTHPDGRISLFNDAAFGIEAEPMELVDYCERLTGERTQAPGERCWSYPETGYYVMAPGPGDRLLIDCGPVGPDYQPGHAHCDTLSFELSLHGRRVIVDSGCCQYVDGDIRRYNRGNSGHNSLTVDGENQSEVWGAHRCGRRAYPENPRLVELADGSLTFTGSHDGYRHLPGSPVHHRTIAWSGTGIRIEDRVDGNGSHRIEARLHIHPDLVVEMREGVAVILDNGCVLATVSLHGGGRIETMTGWYCPEFGVQHSCPVLVARYDSVRLPFSGAWIVTIGVC